MQEASCGLLRAHLLVSRHGTVDLVLHRVLALALRRASQVVRVAEHVVEGHVRGDGHVVDTVHVLDEALLRVRVRLGLGLG